VIIHLEELRGKIQDFTFEKRIKDFPVLEEISAAGDCIFADPLDIRLGAKRLGELVAVEGRAAATVRMTCNRCLRQYESLLHADFTLTYTRQLSEELETADDEVDELQAEKIGLIPFTGEEIHLLDDVQSEIVMAIPMRPLCSETCKGLCPHCGENLNEVACGCQSRTTDPRLAVLKNLKIDRK
jgi:uncharacterized protein